MSNRHSSPLSDKDLPTYPSQTTNPEDFVAFLESLEGEWQNFFFGYYGLSREDKEDIIATALKKIWLAWNTGRFEFRGPGAAKAWLRQRIRFEVMDHRRKQARNCRTVSLDTQIELDDGSTVELAESIASDDLDGDPVRYVEDLEEREQVVRLAEKCLSRKQHQLELVRRRLLGQPDPEGRTQNQINVDWHRASKTLIKQMFGKA